jgi:hypothetical protein
MANELNLLKCVFPEKLSRYALSLRFPFKKELCVDNIIGSLDVEKKARE